MSTRRHVELFGSASARGGACSTFRALHTPRLPAALSGRRLLIRQREQRSQDGSRRLAQPLTAVAAGSTSRACQGPPAAVTASSGSSGGSSAEAGSRLPPAGAHAGVLDAVFHARSPHRGTGRSTGHNTAAIRTHRWF
ncbi:uncharacterized protein PSFLO_05318 [Pseudozyma flocculosa]|uniref:Uncharacterized protein n=1 Tax=Pseudozyma flocculosa TaxID=84751 RepID=A0A5C3F7Y6_9BASI|nr:uncharacterized protein PSFLO_05318 [Pseudozyma flocculosa]